jgi:IPT/TIG domain
MPRLLSRLSEGLLFSLLRAIADIDSAKRNQCSVSKSKPKRTEIPTARTGVLTQDCQLFSIQAQQTGVFPEGALRINCVRKSAIRLSCRRAVLALALFCPMCSTSLATCPSQDAQKSKPAPAAQDKQPAANPLATPAPSTTPAGQKGTKPTIEKPTASSGTAGAQISITGTSFDPATPGNTVKFGETAATVKSATATKIVATIPKTLKAGKTTIVVTTAAGASNAWPFTVTVTAPKETGPAITSLSPSSGSPSSEVKIAGTGFGTKEGKVKFNGLEASLSGNPWTDELLTVIVPPALPLGNASVTVTTSAGESKGMPFTVVAPVVWYGVVSGDFTPFITAGQLVPVHITLLNEDLQVIGQVTSYSLSPTDSGKLQIFYTQPDPKAIPASALIGKTIPGDHQYPFTPVAKPAGTNANVVTYQQVIAGDFCLPSNIGQCTTGLLTLNNGNPIDPPNPRPEKIGAYVQAADGTSEKATVKSIGLDAVDVSFTTAPGFKAAWLILEGNSGARRFVYAPAPPVQDSELIYTSKELETICNLVAGRPDCIDTSSRDVQLKPVTSNSTATFVAVEKKLLVVHIRAPLGSEPTAILVTNITNTPHTSVVVRRTINPGGNIDLLNVDMSIMDQVTALRNYGNRIAKRYIAVTLDVKNPTSKKIQFNKSAMYFDVDYVEAKEKGPSWTGFFQAVGEISTIGLYQPSVYQPPFVAARNETEAEKIQRENQDYGKTNAEKKQNKANQKAKPPRVARFGLEQNVKQAPENYLSVLGSFDYTTQKTDDKLKAVELVGAVLTTIASGGIVADASGAFKAGTSIFSGTFLPGVRGLVLDTSFINRLRMNLVSQTFQETIQVPANGSTTTVVLLPRTGILAFTDAEVSVMIDRVIDVHLIPEVVAEETTATTLQKGVCKTGYTKDQTRDALGEPAGVTTNSDGTSVFTYPTGPVTSASFSAAGSLVTCQTRSLSDQLAQATTLVEMNQTLTSLNLTANKITLTDNSVVLTDIPGVSQSYHFDATGKKTTDYTFLFPKITGYEGQSKSALDSFLEAQAKTLSATREQQITTEATAADKDKTTTATYDSPDVQNGKIVITFDNKSGTAPKASNVKAIIFTGDKPQSVH